MPPSMKLSFTIIMNSTGEQHYPVISPTFKKKLGAFNFSLSLAISLLFIELKNVQAYFSSSDGSLKKVD